MDALATVTYAGTKKNLVESGMVADTPAIAAPSTESEPWKVKIVLEFPRDTDPFLKSTVKAAEAAIKYHCANVFGGSATEIPIEVEIVTEFKSKPRPEVGKMLPQVKNIIAVSRGSSNSWCVGHHPAFYQVLLRAGIRHRCQRIHNQLGI